MSDTKGPGRDGQDGSSLDDVSEEDVEQLEESVDTEDLDEEELVSLDDAARALLAKPRRGHGPIARLYRGETRFDFVGKRRIWFSISTAIILLGIISIVLRGGLNLGIEFKGGTEWTIAAPGVTQTEAVNALKNTGVIDPTVELLGTGSKQTLNVQSDINRLSQSQQDAVSANVQKALLEVTAAHGPKSAPTTTTTKPTTTTTAKAGAAAGSTTTTVPANAVPKTVTDKISITTVGPTWGSSITDKAIEALIIFFIVVAIYISIRFEPKMALAAFIAMIHDVLVAIRMYSIFNFQVTPDTVVAILTILGSRSTTPSWCSTRRDNTKGIRSSGRLTYPQLINLSMNQTLARSINTSMVAIIPVLAILVIGAQPWGHHAPVLRSGPLRRPALRGLLVDLHRLPGAVHDEGARRALGRHRRPAGQARRPARVVLGRRGRDPEHPDERGGVGTGEPERRRAARRSPAAPSAAGRSGPLGSGAGGGTGTGAGTAVMDRPAGGTATRWAAHDAAASPEQGQRATALSRAAFLVFP